jgi:hypothetical protein
MREWAKYGAIGVAGGLLGYALQPGPVMTPPTASKTEYIFVERQMPVMVSGMPKGCLEYRPQPSPWQPLVVRESK